MYSKTIGILSILLLGSLVVLDSCINGNADPVAQNDDTQPSSTTATSPITEAMIKEAELAGPGYKFLADKLRALQQAGTNAGIDDVDTTPNGPNVATDGSGKSRNFTALHYAVCLNSLGIVRALWRVGANKEIKEAQLGATPLILAVIEDKLHAVIALLLQPGINLNAKDNQGRTPLILAASGNKLVILGSLLDQQGILLDERDKAGKTALDYATDSAIQKALMEKGAK